MLLKKAVLTLTVLLATVFYYLFDPSKTAFLPQCSIKKYLGLYCWGCGGQSAFHEFLHFNFSESLRYNILLFPTLVLLFTVYTAEIVGNEKSVYKVLKSKFVWISIILVVVLFMIVRNYFNYGILIR